MVGDTTVPSHVILRTLPLCAVNCLKFLLNLTGRFIKKVKGMYKTLWCSWNGTFLILQNQRKYELCLFI